MNQKNVRRIYYERTCVFKGYGYFDDYCSCIFHHCGRIARRNQCTCCGAGAASGLKFTFWAALFLTLVGGICQLIAGIKGIKHSKRSEKAGKLIAWGVIVAVFSILSIVLDLSNGGDFSIVSVVTGVAVPALYILGAALKAKADAPYSA